jgi:ribosomal protein S18 acetylase RimI-like enzyme
MALPAWREEAISKAHNRNNFDCGVPEINDYLQKHARQNHESGHTTTFVAVPEHDSSLVMGYYSLCNAHLEYKDAPDQLVARMPKYPIPAVRLARLACDNQCKGQGLGTRLLLAAAERAIEVSRNSGAVLLLIDAKDEAAANFYEANDALRLRDDPLHLVIPLASIRDAIASRQSAAPAGQE